MNKKIKALLTLVIIVIIVVVFLVIRNIVSEQTSQTPKDVQPTDLPIDVVLDFYDNWLDMLNDSTVDQYTSDVFMSTKLSDEVRAEVLVKRDETTDFDPITCQTNLIPENFRARVFPASDNEVRVLVESRVEKNTQPMMSFITVNVVDGAWQITDFECTTGDVAPEVEFNYDREGLLLKSVPPPFEAGKWHLVFEQDGQMGHVTPLFFSATTTCVSAEGVESVCNPDTFTETARVIVKGGMTETGAEVVRVEFQ